MRVSGTGATASDMVLADRPAGCEGSTLQPFPGAGRPGDVLIASPAVEKAELSVILELQLLSLFRATAAPSQKTQRLSMFWPQPLRPPRTQLFSMFFSGPRLSERLSPYQCFTQPSFAQPAAPSQRTQLLSLFWPAVTASHENSPFITVLARSHCIPRELSFYHCFGPQSASHENS